LYLFCGALFSLPSSHALSSTNAINNQPSTNQYQTNKHKHKHKHEQDGATSALPKIITTGFRSIHLIYFFTAGADEVKCWQIRKGSKAPQAAGAIHTDFERGFICAEARCCCCCDEGGGRGVTCLG
jgi:ribosome-binding ATPase YchF (GTP1/OBG family)